MKHESRTFYHGTGGSFPLEKKADPLLFVPLTDGRFLLVHQWGKEFILSKTSFPGLCVILKTLSAHHPKRIPSFIHVYSYFLVFQ
jgi:hypothetical protein